MHGGKENVAVVQVIADESLNSPVGFDAGNGLVLDGIVAVRLIDQNNC
jgi:hypothetical protein